MNYGETLCIGTKIRCTVYSVQYQDFSEPQTLSRDFNSGLPATGMPFLLLWTLRDKKVNSKQGLYSLWTLRDERVFMVYGPLRDNKKLKETFYTRIILE